MKKNIGFILIITIIFSVLLFMWITRPIKIGVMISSDSSLGNEEYLFVRYYNEINPTIGFRPVELLIKDAKLESSETEAVYQELIDEGASIIVGGVISNEGLILANLAEKLSIPTFGITSSSSLLSNKNDNFYRLVGTNENQAKLVADLYAQNKYMNLLILTSEDNQSYSDPMVKVINQNFSGTVLEVVYNSEIDFEILIDKHNIDSIFCILDGSDVIEVVNRIRYSHPDVKIGSSSWGSSDIISLFSSDLFNKVWLFSNSLSTNNVEKEAIIKSFEEKYGVISSKGSHYALAVMDAIYKGIAEVGDSKSKLISYFNKPREYETIYGNVELNEFGDSSLNLVLVLMYDNGEIVEITNK